MVDITIPGKPWRSRRVSSGRKPADQFLFHPKNAKFHPAAQTAVLVAALDQVGQVLPVLESARTGFLLDGHDRVWEALKNGSELDYDLIDVDEDEELFILATLDPIGMMAGHDAKKLEELLEEVRTDSGAVQQMLSQLAAANIATGLNGDEWSSALGELPTGDKSPFQQMTFTLHNDQAEVVQRALSLVQSMGTFVDSQNQNSNGNALARVCEMFLQAEYER